MQGTQTTNFFVSMILVCLVAITFMFGCSYDQVLDRGEKIGNSTTNASQCRGPICYSDEYIIETKASKEERATAAEKRLEARRCFEKASKYDPCITKYTNEARKFRKRAKKPNFIIIKEINRIINNSKAKKSLEDARVCIELAKPHRACERKAEAEAVKHEKEAERLEARERIRLEALRTLR